MNHDNPPESLLVIGGQQRQIGKRNDEWRQHRQGVIIHVNAVTGQHRPLAHYETPPEFRADAESAILFKSATRVKDMLYVCTQTEVLTLSLPDFAVQNHISLPSFNDLHHVNVNSNGRLLVANTGLDLVQEIGSDGTLHRFWPTTTPCKYDPIPVDVDFRKVLTTKPHATHVNHVFHIGDEIWATRFNQKDAISLDDPERKIDIAVGNPHDGYVYGNSVYFTTTNGHLVIADSDTLEIRNRIDLNEISGKNRALGWCRGVHAIGENLVIVGFSRFRPTAYQENLRWLKHVFAPSQSANPLPTRIACYDLEKRAMEWEIDLEESGINALFSILPGSPGKWETPAKAINLTLPETVEPLA
jgi:hypothetical protein